MRRRATMSWSGGKDSAFALYRILLSNEYEVVDLHTTFDDDSRRVGLHGVPETLIDEQAKAMGLPLTKLYLTSSDNHNNYEGIITDYYKRCAKERIEVVVFGDIFLEDLRRYREQLTERSGLLPVFPLWQINSRIVVDDFINSGFKALICSANSELLPKAMLGKDIDNEFLKALPNQVDPCGENGEFHSFVYDGPIFKHSVPVECSNVVQRDYGYTALESDGTPREFKSSFWFQDLRLRINS